LIAVVILVALLISGCAPSLAPSAAAAPQPRVYFTGLDEGATVVSPLKMTMAAENFVVEPAGEAKAGAGHLHIMVDTPCINPGQGIPKDDVHLHYGQGQLEAELTLAPGRHTLCLQAADGNHIALGGDGMSQIVSIVVE
jgi:hypothetical protein